MQKRLIGILVMLMMVIGASAVQALPKSDLTATAANLPEDTWLYITVRTDAGYSETLNGLLARLDANTGGDMIPDDAVIPPIADLVNEIIFPSYRSAEPVDTAWLGGTASLAIAGELDPETMPEVYVLFEVADASIITAALTAQGATLTETDGLTVLDYSQPPLYANVAYNDELLVIATGDATVPFNLESNLAGVESFTAALDALPADDYNIAGYVDAVKVMELLSTALMSQIAMGMSDMGGMESMMMMPGMTGEMSGQLAFGLTILEGRTLAFDLAAVAADPEAYMSQPGVVMEEPVNLDFAQNIPGETQFVIHDHDLSSSFYAMIEALDALGPQLQSLVEMSMQQAMMDGGMGGMDDVEGMMMEGLGGLDLTTLNFGGIVKNAIIPVFAGLTGLNLEDDIIAWMSEDYALTLSLLPVPGDLNFTIDAAFLADVTDPAAAANVVEHLATASDLYGLGATREEGAVVYGDLIPSLLADLPASVTQSPELDILVAANDDVFVMGSRPSVDFALNATSGSLLENPVFETASSYFVENPYTVLYINGTSLADAIGALTVIADSPEDVQALQFVVAQIESMTITFNMSESGTSAGRMTITLPESVSYEPPMDEMGNAANLADLLVSVNKVADAGMSRVIDLTVASTASFGK